MNIYEKLLSIQSELKVPKGQFNDFGKYKYRSCEDILEAVKPIAAKHGTLVILSDELINIGERYYIKASASLWGIEDGVAITVNSYAREEESKKGMDGSQITGTASSYARKYALNGLLAIDDTKDSDSTNKGDDAPKAKTEQKPASVPQATPQPQKTDDNSTTISDSQRGELSKLARTVHKTEETAIKCIKELLLALKIGKMNQIPKNKMTYCNEFITMWDDTDLPFTLAPEGE